MTGRPATDRPDLSGPHDPEVPLDLAGRRVVVAGYGVTGRAVAEVLTARGARVTTLDARDPDADVADVDGFAVGSALDDVTVS